MSFGEAVQSVLQRNYANFSGRARRSEYWFWFLFVVIVEIVVRIIGLASTGLYLVLVLVEIVAFLVPGLSVGVRRLHDTGRTGWWLLIGLIPLVGAIVLLVFFCQDSAPDNQYGPSPKGYGGGYGGGYPQYPSVPGGYPQGSYPPPPGGYPPPQGGYPPPPGNYALSQ